MGIRRLVLSCTMFVLSAFAVFLVVNTGQVGGKPGGSAAPVITPVVTCGRITKTCEVTVSVDECKDKVAREKVRELLGDPMSISPCREAQQGLTAECPDGCFLDYSSFVFVPGKTEFLSSKQPESDSPCRTTGKRKVNLRATCRPQDQNQK